MEGHVGWSVEVIPCWKGGEVKSGVVSFGFERVSDKTVCVSNFIINSI